MENCVRCLFWDLRYPSSIYKNLTAMGHYSVLLSARATFLSTEQYHEDLHVATESEMRHRLSRHLKLYSSLFSNFLQSPEQ